MPSSRKIENHPKDVSVGQRIGKSHLSVSLILLSMGALVILDSFVAPDGGDYVHVEGEVLDMYNTHTGGVVASLDTSEGILPCYAPPGSDAAQSLMGVSLEGPLRISASGVLKWYNGSLELYITDVEKLT